MSPGGETQKRGGAGARGRGALGKRALPGEEGFNQTFTEANEGNEEKSPRWNRMMRGA